MVAAFRQYPGGFVRCARAAGVNPRTARRAWFDGWEDRLLRPIKDVYHEEQLAARARLAKAREEELAKLAAMQAGTEQLDKERARDDSIVSIEEETKMVRASRHSAMALQVILQRLLRGSATLAEKVEEQIGTMQLKTPKELILILKELASVTKQANEAARLAQQMEHSLVGKPDQWLGIASNVSPQEAATEVEAAQRAIRRLKKKGLIVTEVVEASSE
jgi:hypothetical protein